ncbi:hypothetical protein [Fluviicola sp.]|uniref:hypothetical protein n=1 Tax=Fluviicola sp. TaxID=1917219 RepID=UPI0031E37E00
MNSPINDVFKFLNVRQAQKLTDEEISARFITYNFFFSIDPIILQEIQSHGQLLYSRLLSDLSKANPRDVMEATVSEYRLSSSFYWETKAELSAIFPGLSSILDYLTSKQFLDTAASFKSEVEDHFIESTIIEYLESSDYLEKKLRLWDILMAEVILPKNLGERELITNFLRVLHIFEEIASNNKLMMDEGGFRKVALASCVLPKPIFPLPEIVNPIDENNTPIEQDNSDIIAAQKKIEALSAALEEITLSLDNQGYNTAFSTKNSDEKLREDVNSATENPIREGPMSKLPVDPIYLTSDSYDLLTEETKEVINLLKIPNQYTKIDTVAARIQKEIDKQTNIVYQKRKGSERVVRIGGALVSLSNYCWELLELEDQRNPCDPFYGTTIPKGSGNIQPIGVADLLVIKQQLLKYEMGEIAHIENILQSEKKEREHRKLERIEETYTTETETTTETQRDTQTTERFALEREISNVVQESQQNQSFNESGFGATLTASYGPASISASYNNSSGGSFASSSASLDAEKVASSYAKEVTEKAMQRVIERVREQRSRTTIDEVVEVNTHGFDNTAGTGHVTGVYHWVDKYYLSKIINYGRRMMFEFMIPEPAAFHIFSQINRPPEGGVLEKPVPLKENGLNNFNDITESNYAHLAALYGVPDITPPPSIYKWVNKAFNKDKTPNSDPYPWPVTFSSNDLAVPDGYVAKSAIVKIMKSWSGWVKVWIGDKWQDDANQYTVSLNDETGIVPFSVMADHPNSYVINVEVLCQRAADTLSKWKISTYNAIVDTYNRSLAAYEEQASAANIQAGVSILGDNPARNREIEKEELKRASLELFTGQKYEAFDAMRDNQPSQGYPQFKNNEAIAEGNYIKFFEQAFEWYNMMYLFYPYFWGRKKNWVVTKNYDDTDPLFMKFLQAGYARVVVPVRPMFTKAVLHYVKTGQIWNGGDPPTIDDDLYLSIVQEIKDAEDDTEGTPVGSPWTVKMPTNLVMLQQTIPPVLPDFSSTLLPPVTP